MIKIDIVSKFKKVLKLKQSGNKSVANNTTYVKKQSEL